MIYILKIVSPTINLFLFLYVYNIKSMSVKIFSSNKGPAVN